MSEALSKFLESFASEATRNLYRIGIANVVWYSKDVDSILKERREDLTSQPNENLIDAKNRASRYDRLLEEYHTWLLKPIHTIRYKPNKAYSLNSARGVCSGILQLFRYYNMTVTLRKGSQVNQTVIATGDFITASHITKSFWVSSISNGDENLKVIIRLHLLV